MNKKQILSILLIFFLTTTMIQGCKRHKGKGSKGNKKSCGRGRGKSPEDSMLNLINNNSNSLDKNTLSNIQNTPKPDIAKAIDSVVKEDQADIPKIHKKYREVCETVIKSKDGSNHSKGNLKQLKVGLCERLTTNTGEKLKNHHLADKMIGILAGKIIDHEFDFDLNVNELMGKSGEINSEILKIFSEKKLECWTNDSEPCGLTDTVKKIEGFSKYIKDIEDASKRIKELREISASKSSCDITSLGGLRRRILFGEEKFGKAYLASKDQVEETKEKELMFENRKANIRTVFEEVNEEIRKYRLKSRNKKKKMFEGIDFINTKFALLRCEKKYGERQCKKMNKVAYCFKCTQGYRPYWRSFDTCGCKIKKPTRNDLWKRFKKMKNRSKRYNEELEDQKKISNLKKKFFNKDLVVLIQEMMKGMKQEKVSEAFFFQVEDMLRKE